MADPLTEEQQQKRRKAVELMPQTPFMGALGIVFERYEPDDVTVRLPFRRRPHQHGVYFHGGVIASVMDTAGAAAAWSNHDFDKGTRASTVTMTIQYTGAAKRSDLLCHSRTVRRRSSPSPRSPPPTPTATWSPTRCRPTGSSDAGPCHPAASSRRRPPTAPRGCSAATRSSAR